MIITADPSADLVRLTERFDVAERTMAFRFGRPRGFGFKAGHCIAMTLVNPPGTDVEGNARTFSIGSAPDEDWLLIATRLRDSAFKRVPATMPVGTAIRLGGPSGNLVPHQNAARPPCSGPTGSASPRSGASSSGPRTNGCAPDPARLLQPPPGGCPVPGGDAGAPAAGPPRHVRRHDDRDGALPPCVAGKTGLVTAAMLGKSLPELRSPVFYLVGPPAMVTALRAVFVQSGAEEDDIRTEEFAGY